MGKKERRKEKEKKNRMQTIKKGKDCDYCTETTGV